MRYVLPLLVLLSACELPPRFIESSKTVDHHLVRRQYKSACVGLKMVEDDPLREYTAIKLAEYPSEAVANTCLCEALYKPGRYDAAVAKGLEGTRRDDLAACLAPGLVDPEIEDRVGLIKALGGIMAKQSFESLAGVAQHDPSEEIRAEAATALRSSAAHAKVLAGIIETDDSPLVRAAAAEALTGRDDPKIVEVVVRAAREDADGGVRAASLKAMVRLRLPETDEMACEAMMEDPDERMREAAVRTFHASKRKESIACLKKRLLTEEESGSVRVATLAALGASPADEAADVLCEAINPYLRLYVKDQIADDIVGHKIIETQNNRDWERSYECVERAIRKGGLSCYARNHIGGWFKELGGKASTPWCPGMVKIEKEVDFDQ